MAVASLAALGALVDSLLVGAGLKASSVAFSVERVPDTVEHRAFVVLPATTERVAGSGFVEWTIELEVRVAYMMPAFRSETTTLQQMIFPDVELIQQVLHDGLLEADVVRPGAWATAFLPSEDGQSHVLVIRVPILLCQNTP